MPDIGRDVVTDPDVLILYGKRIHADDLRDSFNLGYAIGALMFIACEGDRDPVGWARKCLTYMGERSAPLPDECRNAAYERLNREPVDFALYDGPHRPIVPTAGGVPPTCTCGWHPASHPGFLLADHLRDMAGTDEHGHHPKPGTPPPPPPPPPQEPKPSKSFDRREVAW